MKSFFGLFDFRSKEEKARSYEAYSKWIFPYGEEQKERITELIENIFPKLNKRHVLMYYILVKEGMTAEEALDFETAAKKVAKFSIVPVTPELKSGIQALLRADFAIDEKLEYPSIAEIKGLE